ncbi:glycosyltransferase family 8 protein [Dothistroma septosporum NZE10]|uniref:glycogenin glucosyltransferase n=1 Tax=Dothistroma septosporum (strain NZE10 / CBS 128990) TaxID=675120 RepID=N1PYK1_DOTSN|nr:glycosyltransferase family 8 protein [Dothistroma septosporum NZE10]
MAEGEDVYCTAKPPKLVIGDAYLPGAAVLSHSLRDAGTKKKLACLIVQDSLRASTIDELRSLYNYVIPTERIGNPNPANLYLMNRPDLLYTFTKIELWRQTQFRKIVYVDADVVALRAPEELFDITESFAAAPDVGWPDAFNTGVMVISPHMGEYHALKGLAAAADSFDGADQGLLNQYYEHRPWKRISFTYNTTPSANYQYEPAYRYFKSNISMVHFIGREKPWQRGRTAQDTPGAFQEMLSRWWAVYDRHFHISATDYAAYGQRNEVARHVKEGSQHQHHDNFSAAGYPVGSKGPAPPPGTATPSMTEPGEPAENISQGYQEPTPTAEQRRFSAPHMEWDATRGAPPAESKPEAANFPTQQYEFNTNPEPFRPPKSYPEPPRDMWYSVPQKAKEEERPKPIFPWEERQDSRPTRRFFEDDSLPPPPALEPEAEPYMDELEVTMEPVTPTIHVNDSDPWASFAQNKNAWDDVGGINDYVRALTKFQKNRGQVQVVQENTPSTGPSQQHILSPTNEPDAEDLIEAVKERRESLILTDFPTSIERPSLPVTPAPRRRQTFWGEERDQVGDLPGAEGVPEQADWDPSTQLEQLRRSSLMGPSDLKMPGRRLSKRDMPSSAAPITEGTLNHPHDPIADSSGSSGGTSHLQSSSGVGHSHGFDGSSSISYSSQRSEKSTTSQETPINTEIKSSAMSITEAHKPIISTPGSSKVATSNIPARAVPADEIDMTNSESSSSSKQESSSFFSSSSTARGSSFFQEDIVSPTQMNTTTTSDGKDFPGDLP